MIKEISDFKWEIRLNTLSAELNIRLLPLKTLLVYLEMEGIIRPRYAYFNQYALKFRKKPEEILSQFQGERQAFVRTILNNCHTKKIWTYVDIPEIMKSFGSARKRVSVALEYFDEKGWIELSAKQATDVFDILDQSFDIEVLSERMVNLFEEKEHLEIRRIHDMVRFFEHDTCLSRNLAVYFGETTGAETCGHCSVCQEGPADIGPSRVLEPLEGYDFNTLSDSFRTVMGDQFSLNHLTRFLCGIYTPAFTRLRVKDLPYFRALERYPFFEVKTWAGIHLSESA
jgi:ATP-dependent DNA helicase RecQ